MLAKEQERQHGCSDGDRRPVDVAGVLGERSQLGGHGVSLHRDAGELVELADDHQHGHAGHVADQHRFGQQIRQKAESGEPGDHAEGGDDQGKRSRQRHVAPRISSGEGSDRYSGHQCRRRLGADRQLWRRSDDDVDGEGTHESPEPGDHRQPSHRRVPHDLGNRVGGEGDPGDDVTSQPTAFVAPQPLETGEKLDIDAPQCPTATGQPEIGTCGVAQRDSMRSLESYPRTGCRNERRR